MKKIFFALITSMAFLFVACSGHSHDKDGEHTEQHEHTDGESHDGHSHDDGDHEGHDH